MCCRIISDPESTERMGAILKNASRDIVFSICADAQPAYVETYKRYCHMFRGLHDTKDEWLWLVKNHFYSDEISMGDWRSHSGPAHWFDLDMLAAGPQHSDASSSKPNAFSINEQIAHMSLWVIYPSPLILSCDLSSLSDFDLRLFANEEIIAVNQDKLGRVRERSFELRQTSCGGRPPRNCMIHSKQLSDGSLAIGIFNLADNADDVPVDLAMLGFKGQVSVRNLWERRDMGRFEKSFSIPVPMHGAQILKLSKA